MRATMKLATERLLAMLRDLVVIPKDGEPWIARDPGGRADALVRLLRDYRRELGTDDYLTSACNRLADEFAAKGGSGASPEQSGCFHLREGHGPNSLILASLLMAVEWLDAADKDRPSEVTPNDAVGPIVVNLYSGDHVEHSAAFLIRDASNTVEARTTSVRRDPKSVRDALVRYRQILAQDVESLRMAWPSLVHHQWPNHETVSAVDYLRSRLLTFQTSGKSTPADDTPAAWHPFILGYCRILGADAVAVDRLYQRIVVGDLSDEREVVSIARQAFAQLDIAIKLADEQWISGESVILTPAVGGQHDNGNKPENKLPENPDVLELCRHLKAKRSKFGTIIECARAFCRKELGDESKADNLLRQAKRFRHLWPK